VDTAQAISVVKTNIDLSREAFSEKLASNTCYRKDLLFKINKVLSKLLSYILHYYIIIFIFSVLRLVHYFHVLSLSIYMYIVT
jgi:hypothetical protein